MTSTPTVPMFSGRAQLIFPAVIAVLTVALLASIGDVVVAAMASTAAGSQYRFQIVGLLFANMPQFSIILMLIVAIATIGGVRLAVRWSSVVSIILGALVIVLLFVFALDFLQSRRLVPQNNLQGFTLAALKTGGFAAWLALLLLWAGWRGIQSSKSVATEQRTAGDGLVVGQR